MTDSKDYTFELMESVRWSENPNEPDTIFIIMDRWRTWNKEEERYRIIHNNQTYIVSKYFITSVPRATQISDAYDKLYDKLYPLKSMPIPNNSKEEKNMSSESMSIENKPKSKSKSKSKPFRPHDYKAVRSVSIERLMQDRACPEAVAYLAKRYSIKGYEMNGLVDINSNELARLYRFDKSWIEWLENHNYIKKTNEWKPGDMIMGIEPQNYKWIILEKGNENNSFRAFSIQTNNIAHLIYCSSYKNLGPLHNWVKDIKA